jgi:phosphatidylglycerophosphatase A
MSAAGSPARSSARKGRPILSIFLATACGLGYIPKAPGTFGSVAGLVLALLPYQLLSLKRGLLIQTVLIRGVWVDPLLVLQIWITLCVALLGVWTATRAARYWHEEDPQRVVTDEVSGQHITLLLGSALPIWWRPAAASWAPSRMGFITYQSALNWKYLLLGLILFRVFDIWKPFPVRQAESLPAGWGIMADDWVAAIYAGLILWIARALGL